MNSTVKSGGMKELEFRGTTPTISEVSVVMMSEYVQNLN